MMISQFGSRIRELKRSGSRTRQMDAALSRSKEASMSVFTRTILSILVAVFVDALLATSSPADLGYAIRSTNTPLSGAVTSDSVQINVTAPSTALILRSTLTLNGKNVSSALQPDANGSMTGTVSGLQVGSNVFKLFVTKGTLTPAATLIIERATAPAIACSAIPSLTGFPVQPVGSVGGTTITSAVLTAATQTLPEHCLVRGVTQQRIGTD